MKDEITQLTKQLIAIPSVSSDIDENVKALEFIRQYINLPDAHITYHDSSRHPSLVITLQPNQKVHDVIFHGHTDVLPGENGVFQPKIRMGSIYGRGAIDMKGGLAALITLFKQLHREKSDKKLTLMITTDEELGGRHGTRHLLEDLGYSANFFLSGEGVQKNHIITRAKGIVRILVIAQGKTTHSARPWDGDNAITKLTHAIHDIQSLFPFSTDEIHWHSTATVSQIKGGEASNSVPAYAEALFDIRFTEEWKDGETIVKHIDKILLKYKGVTCQMTDLNTGMLLTEEKNPHVQKLAAALLKHKPDLKNPFGFAHGSSDARFASDMQIPAVEYGPKGYFAHQPNEHVEIAELERYYNVCKTFVNSL